MTKVSEKHGFLEQLNAVNHAFAKRENDLLHQLETLNNQLNQARIVADATETHLQELVKKEQVVTQALESTQLEIVNANRENAELIQEVQTLNQQLQARQDEFHRLAQERSQREKEHTDLISQLRQEMDRLLSKQMQREQEIAAQLLTIQQQVNQEKAEQAREHANREQSLSQQLLLTQQELQHIERVRVDVQQLLNEQLRAERETCLKLSQALHILHSEIATMRNSLSWRLTTPLRSVAALFSP